VVREERDGLLISVAGGGVFVSVLVLKVFFSICVWGFPAGLDGVDRRQCIIGVRYCRMASRQRRVRD
jgi:hypothetical protein